MEKIGIKVICGAFMLACFSMRAVEVPTFSEIHGYKEGAFTLRLDCATEDAVIYYTTDCSTPTEECGILYTSPIEIKRTATIRAVAIDSKGAASTLVAATYIFPYDVLGQSEHPAGYPSEWGPYCSIEGNAIADYGMDPELYDTQEDADKIIAGLKSLPTISIITDPGYLFSHEKDEEKGGIYIYTGGDAGSTGNGYGAGWLRAASIEFWESDKTLEKYWAPQNDEEGFQVNCAIKIHGNASKQPEKTPKHSIRMKMKGDYGPKKLHYRLYGEEGGKKFDQIVLRAGFGNTWLHWLTGQQQQAMYTRDAWAKRMMAHLGHLSSGTRFANLFINGMYWGVYNPTERIDADFCELHLGGNALDYDVVRYEYTSLDTVDGTTADYESMLEGVAASDDYAKYLELTGQNKNEDDRETIAPLLDIDNFIDYMLINYYGGNTDWDHHNWVAVHQYGGNEGFKWLPWDSELVLQNVNDNVTKTYNEKCPTYIFNTLMDKSMDFRVRFVDRANYALCETFGYLQPDSAQSIWEDLTEEISDAMYAESARWGDYRRDVHPYVARGALYTKEQHFDNQCEYMRSKYFPERTKKVLKQLKDAGFWLNVEDAPSLYVDELLQQDYIVRIEKEESEIKLQGSSTIYYSIDGNDPIAFTSTGGIKLSESAIRAGSAISLSDNCILKARVRSGNKNWGPLLERQIIVDNGSGIYSIEVDEKPNDENIYNLMGQPVTNPGRGIYIQNNRLIIK